MKKNFKIFTVIITVLTLLFFFNQCGASEEKKDEKVGDTKEAAVQGDASAQENEKTKENNDLVKNEKQKKSKKIKSILPKRLIEVELTDEQKTKCEAAYKEIYTPEVIAKRKPLISKLKGLEKGSDEYENVRKEIAQLLKPYRKQFNATLKEILTEEQQEKYFKKRKAKKKK
jgi:hypothetical protein